MKPIYDMHEYCFGCRGQEPTKNVFNLTSFFFKSPLLTTAIASSPRNLPPRSIGETDDRGTLIHRSAPTFQLYPPF